MTNSIEGYWVVYEAALKELADLTTEMETVEQRREELDQRIAEVKKGVLALAPLCRQQPWVKHPDLFPEMSAFATFGLTPSIRALLSKPPIDWMSPVGIRDSLKTVGYETTSTNILPSIHTVLKRLIESGSVETENRDGRTWYRWKGEPVALTVPPLALLRRAPTSGTKRGGRRSAREILTRSLTTPKRAESSVDQMIEQVEDASRKKRDSFVNAIQESGKPKKD